MREARPVAKSPFCPLPRSLGTRNGFTLIEIAIAMIIIGILAGGGAFVMGMLTERKARNESIDYLHQAREALLSYAGTQGRLPSADTNQDGAGDGATAGGLPYLDLKVRPTDFYKRVLRYEINPNLDTGLSTTCGALRSGLSGSPQVVDGDGSPTAFPVAAVLVSPGPRDADGNGNTLDDMTTGTHQGDNTDGTPNYLRFPPTTAFDDLVLYIGENELYSGLCEYLTLAVINNSVSTVYVYDHTLGSNLGTLAAGTSGVYEMLSGTQVSVRDAGGGGGSPVASTPGTPIFVAGRGYTIDVP
jgi:prepilin-type N-terminal cleavage/methylation domain-containing protein